MQGTPELSYIILGGLITVVANVVLHAYRTHHQRQSLRTALIEEMEQANEMVSIADRESIEETGLTANPFPRSVYEGNSSNLGLLTESEVRKVTNYYNNAHLCQNLIDLTQRLIFAGEWDSDSGFSETLADSIISTLEARNEAIIEIKEMKEKDDYRIE